MADWRKRAKKTDDVVFFSYAGFEQASNAKDVYIWDVDKTYLDTKFETLRGLLRTATEKPSQKKNIPGAAELVRALHRHHDSKNTQTAFPLFFITGSPPQMENKIRAKLEIDNVYPLAIFCKDNLPNLKPRRFWRLNKQVGYKLLALLQLRTQLPDNVRMTMFGDDGEADSIIYSMFSDICSRRYDTSYLREMLSYFHVTDEQIESIFKMQNQTPKHDPVSKIYINLIDDTDPDYYLKFGRRVLPTTTSLQVALDLVQDGRLDLINLGPIASNLMNEFKLTKEEIAGAIEDMVRRQRLSEKTLDESVQFLKSQGAIAVDFMPSLPGLVVTRTESNQVIEMEGVFDPWVAESVDYTRDYR